MTLRLREKLQSFLAPTSGIHAVLLYGAENGPVQEAAQALSRAWLCQNLASGEACGECRSCLAIGRGNHVDYKVIAPKGLSSMIRIGQITMRDQPKEEEPEQSLQEFFRTAPLFGSRKVAVIGQADRMNPSASNALLKTLEEPHPYAKLILTTTALGDLLPTILSRCANVPVEMTEPTPKSPGEEAVDRIAARTVSAQPAEALLLADDLRDAASLFGADGVRANQALALKALAQSLLIQQSNRPKWAQSVIEVHRRIIGNGAGTLNIDALFTTLLAI